MTPSSSLARRAVLGALVCQMGLGLGGYVLAAFLRPIVAELGWSRAAFSVSTLPFLLGMSLASPLVGGLTDRLGPHRVFAAGIVVVAGTLAGLSSMQTLWEFYAWGFVLGLGVTGLGDIPAGTVVARHVGAHAGLALGVAYIGSNIGGALVPLIASAVTEAANWRVALQVLGAIGLAVILPAALWIVPDGRNGDAEGPAPDETAAAGMSLAEARGTRSFWILGFVLFSFYFYYVGINHHLVAFLTDEGFTDAAAARRFSFVVAVGIAGKLGIGAIADRVGLRRAMLLTFGLLTAASWLLLILGHAPRMLPVFLTVHGFTVAAENVLLPLAITACFGARHLPAIYGALMLALLPGGALGPYLSGLSFDRLGTYQPAFATFAIGNLFALVGLMTLPLGGRHEVSRFGASADRGRGPGGGP